ncbi:MAG TPA: hypothetical protein DF715_04275 [Oceanicaulis sp.]|nr:hypothetical protein [Oceanicaulis sp.]
MTADGETSIFAPSNRLPAGSLLRAKRVRVLKGIVAMQETGGDFARWINVERLGREPMTFDVVATESENAALAKSLDIEGVSDVHARGSLSRRGASGQIELTGRLTATATQACVVTLEPVSQAIDVEFTVFYTFDPGDLVIEEAEKVVGMEEPDLPELIVGSRLNLADMITEQIALALDPYPRSADAPELMDNEETLERAKQEQGVHRPFANLKDLMNKK